MLFNIYWNEPVGDEPSGSGKVSYFNLDQTLRFVKTILSEGGEITSIINMDND